MLYKYKDHPILKSICHYCSRSLYPQKPRMNGRFKFIFRVQKDGKVFFKKKPLHHHHKVPRVKDHIYDFIYLPLINTWMYRLLYHYSIYESQGYVVFGFT
jgi:hypothetical protein